MSTQLQFDISIDTTEATRALEELYRVSFRTNYEVLTFNAIDLVKSLAFNTPRVSGNLAAGWWPAYFALDIPGTPNTRRSLGHNEYKGRNYYAEGTIEDRRMHHDEPYFEVVNNSYVLIAWRGKEEKEERLNYQHIEHSGGSVAEKIMDAANAEVVWKWRGKHAQLLRKYSAA